MDQQLYDIYFTGKLVEGANVENAKASFAKMFKASPEATTKFFNGKPQALKRGVDKNEALKYKAALHKAGMMVAFKAHQAEPTRNEEQPQPSTSATEEDWSLAPAGSDVLKEDERNIVPEREIDTSAIKMVSAFSELEPKPKDLPSPPNTSHISVAQVGEDLLVDKPEAPPPLPLDLDAITLAPAGTELEELHDDLPALNPDISGISMADVGADLLEGQVKKKPPPAPSTDHISVAD